MLLLRSNRPLQHPAQRRYGGQPPCQLPLGAWLALSRPTREGGAAGGPGDSPPVLTLLAAAVGCVGGIYGIGGGSILAPVLIGAGQRPEEVAPAALASTFVTSVAGVVTLSGSAAPGFLAAVRAPPRLAAFPD
jgi:uncharacterized membrane protein YfcA